VAKNIETTRRGQAAGEREGKGYGLMSRTRTCIKIFLLGKVRVGLFSQRRGVEQQEKMHVQKNKGRFKRLRKTQGDTTEMGKYPGREDWNPSRIAKFEITVGKDPGKKGVPNIIRAKCCSLG